MSKFTFMLALALTISRLAVATCVDNPPNEQVKIYVRSHVVHHFNGEEPSSAEWRSDFHLHN